MNYIDIVLAVLLLWAAINGFRKGLIVEVASLAALILGIWGAIEFSDYTSNWLVETFQLKTQYLNVIAFLVTFAAIVVLIQVLGTVLSKIVESIMLGFVNKLAGSVFGILRTALILSVVLMIFDRIDHNMNILPKDTKESSRMYEPIRSFAPSIFPFISDWNFHSQDKKIHSDKEATI